MTKRRKGRIWKAVKVGMLFVAAFLIVWTISAVVLARKVPNIAVDYVALLNEPGQDLSPDEKAWPEIRAANVDLLKLVEQFNAGADRDPESSGFVLDNETYRRFSLLTEQALTQGLPPWDNVLQYQAAPLEGEWHPDQETLVRFFTEAAPHTARLREAAARPGLGFPFSTTGLEKEDAVFFGTDGILAADPSVPYNDGSVMNITMPFYGTLRQSAKCLLAEGELALIAGDTERYLADVFANFELARHAKEGGVLIGYLVEISIYSMTFESILDALAAQPDSFQPEELAALEDRIKQITLKIDLTAERYYYDDITQRIFSDDGSGDGVLLRHGMQMMGSIGVDSSPMSMDPVGALVMGPVVAVVGPSRRQSSQLYHTFMDRMQSRLDAEVFAINASDSVINGMSLYDLSWYERVKTFPASLLTPAIENLILRLAEIRLERNTTLAAIGLLKYESANGAWPKSLDQLPSSALLSDSFDGKTLRFELSNGKATIWSVGKTGDGKDVTWIGPGPTGDLEPAE